MNSLKLTAYFAERQRSQGRFLAESMLDLFEQRQVSTSVLLRGISGFGHQRIIRTDQSLSLSEDPAVAVAAVDSPEVIGALAGDVVAMTGSGLLTLERARLLGDDMTSAPLPEGAVKLTVYLGRNRRYNGVPAYKALCALLHRHGFAGVSVCLGVDGTAHGERRRAHLVGRNTDVPLMIIAIGSPDQVRSATTELGAVMDQPLVTVERVQLCKRDGRLLDRPTALPDHDAHGRPLWQKLMVFTSEATRHDGVPIHRALVRRLWETGAASGATVLRGIWGFHGDHEPHGDKLIQLGRQVPVMTVIVDTPSNIARSFEIVDDITGQHGLVTCETVPALLAVDGADSRGGLDLADT